MKTNRKLLRFDIDNRAASFRKMHGFGETDPIRLDSLLQKQNIITLFRHMDGNFAGMAIKASNVARFMLVNSSHSVGKQHFTIAHELYHLMVQEQFTSQRCITGLFDNNLDEEERKADYFAASLLMPQLGVFELIPENERQQKNTISTETIFCIQHYYSVSFKAVIHRLVDFELVDKTYYDRYKNVSLGALALSCGFDTHLLKIGNEGKTVGDYALMASRLYKTDRISEGFYLELLNAIGFDPYSDDVILDEN